MSYYYLISSLPAFPAEGKEYSFESEEVFDLILRNLSAEDRVQFDLLLLQHDVKHLVNLVMEEWHGIKLYSISQHPMIYLSLADTSASKAVAKFPDAFAEYIYYKLDTNDQHNILDFENAVWQFYYQHIQRVGNAFLKSYYTFDRRLSALMTTLQLQRFEYEIESQLIILDEIDELLVKKRLSEFEKMAEMQIVNQMQDVLDKDEPEALIKYLRQLKWEKIDSLMEGHYFDLENVLGYSLKLDSLPLYLNKELEEPLEKEAEKILQYALKDT